MADDLKIQSVLDMALKQFASEEFQKSHWEGFSIYCMMIACSFRTEYLKTFKREPSGWNNDSRIPWKTLQENLTKHQIHQYTNKTQIHADMTEFVGNFSGATRIKQLETQILNQTHEIDALKSKKNRLEGEISKYESLQQEIKKLETKVLSITSTNSHAVENINRHVNYLYHKETREINRLFELLKTTTVSDAAINLEIKSLLTSIKTKLSITDSSGKTLEDYVKENEKLSTDLATLRAEKGAFEIKVETIQRELDELKAKPSSATTSSTGIDKEEVGKQLKFFFESSLFFMTDKNWRITRPESFDSHEKQIKESILYLKGVFKDVADVKKIDDFFGTFKNPRVFLQICDIYTTMFDRTLKFQELVTTFNSLSTPDKTIYKKISGLSNVTLDATQDELGLYLASRNKHFGVGVKKFEFSLCFTPGATAQTFDYIPTNHEQFFLNVHSSRDLIQKQNKILIAYYTNIINVTKYIQFLAGEEDTFRIHTVLETILAPSSSKPIPDAYKQVLQHAFQKETTTGLPFSKDFIVQICCTFNLDILYVYFMLPDGRYCVKPTGFIRDLLTFLNEIENKTRNPDEFQWDSFNLQKL